MWPENGLAVRAVPLAYRGNPGAGRTLTLSGTSRAIDPSRQSESGAEGMEVAGSTGLEPAASGVTGRRSNQLNYDPALGCVVGNPILLRGVCPRRHGPPTAQARRLASRRSALPLVGGAGFEP